jgi:hypothetical protein
MIIKTGIKRVASNIEEEIVVDSHLATYPYKELVVKVWGRPTKKGMKTEEYQDLKSQMGDDWYSDITNHWWEEHSCLSVDDMEKLNKIIEEVTFG